MQNAAAPLPYSDIAPVLLATIYKSLAIICSAKFHNTPDDRLWKQLRSATNHLSKQAWAKAQKNAHIIEGIKRREGTRKKADDRPPRISRLCLEAFLHAQKTIAAEKNENQSHVVFLPSPLSILIDVLTVPSRPESAAYGFALARAFLFSRFRIHPSERNHGNDGWSTLKISDIQDAVESFITYYKHRDNIHKTTNSPARAVVAHFLAMTGVFRLRFGTKGKDVMSRKRVHNACLSFCAQKEFVHLQATQAEEYEFRLGATLVDFPDTQEIVNSLMGIPLPIGGASTVFFGGMQKSHHDSLVVSISGTPGTGKTSLALAIAAGMAPYGTQCLYCTFEEDAKTLQRRVQGIMPQYFRRSTLPRSSSLEWFSPITLDPSEIGSVEQFDERYLKNLKETLKAKRKEGNRSSGYLPAIAPLLVVIDSLTTLYNADHQRRVFDFCRLVEYLRQLDCIVLLLSADDIPKESRLEYLVDTVIALRHEGTDGSEKKPKRLFQLLKTRLQLSRPGSHVLHLSGDKGVRISPQLPSQLDAREIHQAPLPDRSCIIDTLFVDKPKASEPRKKRLINLFRRSRILIYGHGSSGKAPLALKLLMSPPVREGRGLEGSRTSNPSPRVLVVSFLYPKAYYDSCVLRLGLVLRKSFDHYVRPKVSSLVLTPGFIGPEDFIGRVISEMDRGNLEGRPYTGILIDGLHNVFLQFPTLQASGLVWPTLFNLLNRYELTIISTYTAFSNNQSPKTPDLRDSEIVL